MSAADDDDDDNDEIDEIDDEIDDESEQIGHSHTHCTSPKKRPCTHGRVPAKSPACSPWGLIKDVGGIHQPCEASWQVTVCGQSPVTVCGVRLLHSHGHHIHGSQPTNSSPANTVLNDSKSSGSSGSGKLGISGALHVAGVGGSQIGALSPQGSQTDHDSDGNDSRETRDDNDSMDDNDEMEDSTDDNDDNDELPGQQLPVNNVSP